MKEFLKCFAIGLLICILNTFGLLALPCGIWTLTQIHLQEVWVGIILFLFAVILIALGIVYVSVIGLLICGFDECTKNENTNVTTNTEERK